METITFAAYHTDLREETVRNILNKFPVFKKQKWQQNLLYSKQCIDLMFKSVQRVYRSCRCVLLSDLATPFDPMEGVEVIRYPVDPEKPAYMRLKAQIHFLREKRETHLIFLDYDMLVQHDLSDLFAKNFDIGFTYRLLIEGKFCPCPINGGLIFVPWKHRKEACSFLELVKAIYDKEYSDDQEWGGFQGAVNDAVGDDRIFYKTSDIVTAQGIRILLLPVEEYNYTIVKPRLHPVEYFPKKKILHFKGSRKEDMLDYWNEYLYRTHRKK